jgi:hypothetical protein
MRKRLTDDQLHQTLVTLRSIKNSLPAIMPVLENVVNRYHEALENVSTAGLDMTTYEIPKSQIQRRPIAFDTAGQATQYSTWRYVDRTYFVTMLDAATDRLKLVQAQKGAILARNQPADSIV